MWMIEDYPSTCPHNSGSFAFMLNIVCLVEATEVRGVVPSLVFSSCQALAGKAKLLNFTLSLRS